MPATLRVHGYISAAQSVLAGVASQAGTGLPAAQVRAQDRRCLLRQRGRRGAAHYGAAQVALGMQGRGAGRVRGGGGEELRGGEGGGETPMEEVEGCGALG